MVKEAEIYENGIPLGLSGRGLHVEIGGYHFIIAVGEDTDD